MSTGSRPVVIADPAPGEPKQYGSMRVRLRNTENWHPVCIRGLQVFSRTVVCVPYRMVTRVVCDPQSLCRIQAGLALKPKGFHMQMLEYIYYISYEH